MLCITDTAPDGCTADGDGPTDIGTNGDVCTIDSILLCRIAEVGRVDSITGALCNGLARIVLGSRAALTDVSTVDG